ncbi:MAG: L-lactate permease [Chloroflexi bacterium]|nr:L-lactate permease [Chloroflexota bacterium]
MLVNWLLAALPITLVLVLMIGFRFGAARAGVAGWAAAIVVAAARFGAGPQVIAYAQAKSLLLSLYVLYIVWAALFFYHVVNGAGGITTIAARLPALSSDRGAQALLLAWIFGGFLQSVSGFGVPTAVVAPLLVGIGMTPVAAVVAAGIGHAWAVTFGSLGLAFQALVVASNEPAAALAPSAALLLGLACFGCGFAILWSIGGIRVLARNVGLLVVVGLGMSAVQFAAASAGLYTIAALLAALTGIGLAIVLVQFQKRLGRWHRGETGPLSVEDEASASVERGERTGALGARGDLPIGLSLMPYLVLLVIISLAQFVPPVTQALDSVVIRVDFPELNTGAGYTTPAESGQPISVLGHPAAQLVYASILTLLIYQSTNRYGKGWFSHSLRQMSASALASSAGIVAMVAMAFTMQQSGMTLELATGIGRAAGAGFPLVAPFIGSLGAFVTGSNLNSNVIFAPLQTSAAKLLTLPVALILAAQTAGGAIGSVFSPAQVIVGCTTVGLGGKEGPALTKTMMYGLGILLSVGVVILLLLGLR